MNLVFLKNIFHLRESERPARNNYKLNLEISKRNQVRFNLKSQMFWLYNFEYFATAFQIAKKFAKLRKSNGILGMLKTVNDLLVRAFSRVQTLPAGI